MRTEDLLAEDMTVPNLPEEVRSLRRATRDFSRSQMRDSGGARAPSALHSPWWNFITVAKEGGDFDKISDALIGITDASSINRYCILIYPGTYDEEVTMKEYVALVGVDRDVCIITSDDAITLEMASNSSLNELTIENTYTSDNAWGIRARSCDDTLIDSCIIKAGDASSIYTVNAIDYRSCTDFRMLGSEVEAFTGASGSATGIRVDDSLSPYTTHGEIRYSRVVLPSTAAGSGYGIYAVSANEAGDIQLQVLHSWVRVNDPDGKTQQGIRADAVAAVGDVAVYVEHTSVEETGGAGSGVCLYSYGAGATIHVRASRYATQGRGDSGLINGLQGDIPLQWHDIDATSWSCTSGAAAYQTDPNLSVSITLPCKCSVTAIYGYLWQSNTVRVTSFGLRSLYDATTGNVSGYYGANVANTRNYAGLTEKWTLAEGTYTISCQGSRVNAADTVTITSRHVTIIATPVN